MDAPKPTRRTMIKRAGLVAAASASLSGCTEALPPLGSRVQYGRVDTPPVNGDPTYRQWLPAASVLPTDDLDPGYVNYVQPGDLGQQETGTANKDAHFFQKPYLDYFGIDYEAYDTVIGLHRTTKSTYVLEGDIQTETVAETLLESGYTAVDSYQEYDLFDRGDSSRTAAVSPEAIVWAHHEQSTAIVEAVIDAKRGAVPRHHETDDAFAQATDAIGAGAWTMIGGLGIDPTRSALVRSMTYTPADDGIYYIHKQLYPENDVTTEQALRDALEENTRARDSRSVDIQIDGHIATIAMHHPHESLQTDYADVTVPVITWGVENGGETLTIRHEGGDTTPAEAITVSIQHGSERTEIESQFSHNVDRIQRGDTLTFDVPDTDADRIVGKFAPTDAARSASFVLYELP